MINSKEKYVSPFTDFGFKKIFGEEPNKDLLLDFLNELLKEEQGKIIDLTYLKNEHLSRTEFERRAIFDLYCENEKGEKFIVELQKTKQNFFKDRTVYYSTFPIREQAQKGEWNYELKSVYLIAILDFIFDEDKKEPEKYRYDVKLTDIQTKEIFYDKLTFIYLEMPKFNKSLSEIETRFDKWLYLLRNLHKLDRIPDKTREKIFEKLFETAEIAKFTNEQMTVYEESLKNFRDLYATLETKYIEGKIEGKAEGLSEGIKKGIIEGEKKKQIEISKKMLDQKIDIELVKNITGLSKEEIFGLNN